MVRAVFAMISALFRPVQAGANTLNIHVRPHIPINTTLRVNVTPQLYRDVVVVESCDAIPKRKDRSFNARKRCGVDD